jgi:dipeptidyl aminopeptidase/acylaminoacyl peptidase
MFRNVGVCAAVVAAVLVGAQPVQAVDLADIFGTRDSVQHISLSPDGTKIAYVAPAGSRGSGLYVASLGGGAPKVIAGLDGNPRRFGRCNWVANDRLACSVYAVEGGPEVSPISRMVAIDADGKNVKMLTEDDSLNQQYANLYGGQVLDFHAEDDGAILIDRWFVPEEGDHKPSRLTKRDEGYGVVEINTRNLSTKTVEKPKREAADFLTDGHGHVRIMGIQPQANASGQASEVLEYSYRTAGSGGWRPLGRFNVLNNDGIRPLGIDAKLNALYALQKVDGRQALYRISLDGSQRQELILSRPDVDVDDVIEIGRSRRPVGATYATDIRQSFYFDPELKQLADSLSRAIPNLPLIGFIDASEDESKLLLRASSDVDPGRIYVFDKTARKLSEIMLVRPELEGAQLAKVKPVTYQAADGSSVPAYLTLPPTGPQKNIPAIVMPHGGPSARDEWGFDWLPQFYAASGYAVIQPNYRGSSGFGDDWYERNGFQSWKTAIGDVADAGRWLVQQGIADPKKLAIVGWSYGGYAALQAAETHPGLFKAVIAIAPVTDLQALKDETRGWSSHAIESKFIGQGAHVREGSPIENVAQMSAPVMLFHGTYDHNVDVKQSERMAARLRQADKSVELITYAGLDHGLPDSQARADMLRKSDHFLKQAFAKQ